MSLLDIYLAFLSDFSVLFGVLIEGVDAAYCALETGGS